MKMGNLNEEAWMNAAEARLIGALIGLARATDGNTVRTEETGRLMRVGLAALTQGEQKEFYEAMVEKIHAEKRLLAPDCATCGAPCGKTADYDINQWKKEAEPVREQKILLLKRLVEVGYLLTKALFALGESWETEWVKVLVKEADGYLVSKEDY